MEIEAKEQKEYEIAFLVKTEAVLSEILRLVKQAGGEVNAEGPIKKIALSYPIKKEHAAYFGYLNFRLGQEKINKLEEDLRLHASVLRYLIVVKPFVKAVPSTPAVMEKPKREASARIVAPPKESLPLSNEELERKIDEILS